MTRLVNDRCIWVNSRHARGYIRNANQAPMTWSYCICQTSMDGTGVSRC